MATLLIISAFFTIFAQYSAFGAPLTGAGETVHQSTKYLQNVSLGLNVLDTMLDSLNDNEYVSLCKLGMAAADFIEEEKKEDDSNGIPSATSQVMTQTLQDICQWFSKSTTIPPSSISSINCTTPSSTISTVKSLCAPILSLSSLSQLLEQAITSISSYDNYSNGNYSINETQVDNYVREIKEEIQEEGVAYFITAPFNI